MHTDFSKRVVHDHFLQWLSRHFSPVSCSVPCDQHILRCSHATARAAYFELVAYSQCHHPFSLPKRSFGTKA
jgi:hypothetical protein